jgi:hypothetical protein
MSPALDIVEVPPNAFVLSASRLGVQTRIPDSAVFVNNHLTMQSEYDRAMKATIYTLNTYLLRAEHRQMHTEWFGFPATWWDHFKKSHLPVWWVKRFPVKYAQYPFEYEKHSYLCPHANLKWPDIQHIEFMTRQDLAKGDTPPLDPPRYPRWFVNRLVADGIISAAQGEEMVGAL